MEQPETLKNATLLWITAIAAGILETGLMFSRGANAYFRKPALVTA